VLSQRPEMIREDAVQMVGVRPVDPEARLIAGAHFLDTGAEANMDNDQGWMSSVAYSPTLGHAIGLGFLARGAARMGETLRAVSPVHGTETEVEVVSPHFVDPEGERLRG